uniref:Malate dehydrogenase 1B n=1 Tax=Macaca mulatta TaxID=9544 RepID=A0A5F7ZBD3_MACMU
MAKFVIAGRADCPYYAKTELLADYLQKNLPDFRIHKITQRPEVWEDWLKDVCEKNKWSHKNSPIIWRELLDRGGKGLLLGGYNEFLEHAQLYYDVTSSMTTELMMVIAQENLGAHIQKEQEEEGLKTCINPLQVWITSEWIKREFVATLKNLTATGRQFGGILAAHSIATTLKYWYHGSPPGEIVSLGILSEGQFGIPKGIVFSMPVKFENGTWVVLTDLKDTEISEQIMTRMTSDLIQEKLVALGDKIHFQPYQSETELRKKDKRISLPITDDSQKEQVSDGFEGKTVES